MWIWLRANGPRRNDINFLELRAIRLGLLHFHSAVEGKYVLILTDNITLKAHINRQGRTRSKRLMMEAQQLVSWAETHLC